MTQRAALMMRKLESYNAFTEKLEYEAVMAGSIKLAQNPRAFGLSEQAGREARLIVTDESHYAYVAVELIKGIRTSICAGRGFWRLGLTHTMLRSFCGITIRQTR